MNKNVMKKNSFIGGALVSTIAIIIVKIIGIIYVIPFHKMIGSKGGALYGYGYNIYALFLSISSAGFPFAVSKLTSEYLASGNKAKVSDVYRISRNIIFGLSLFMFVLLFALATPIAMMIAPTPDKTGGNTIADIAFVLRAVSFAVLIVPFLSVTRGFLQGHKIITPGSVSQIIEQLVRVIVLLVGCYVALNVFHMGLTMAVGISVFAACVGGLFSLLYLQFKLHRSNLLEKEKKEMQSAATKKIIKQLSFYAIPYVIISAISNLYEITDMVIVQRVLSDILKLDASTVETVSSVFTIWGGKFNGIILALVIGMNTSLTPNIVTSFTEGNVEDVNDKINRSLALILYSIVPLTIFLSTFTGLLWTIFYDYNEVSISVYQYFVFYALFGGVFTVIVNILQSLSKYKEVIISIVIGLIFNVLLDGPFILLFHKLGFVPAAGAVVCGLCAYTLSITYAMVILYKRYQISFKKLWKKLVDFIIPWFVFIFMIFITKQYMTPILNDYLSSMIQQEKLIHFIVLACNGITCFGVYAIASYLSGALKNLLDPELLQKIPFLRNRKQGE